MPGVVAVHGLTELNRAFGRLDRGLKRELGGYLRAAAEPVRADAERLAAEGVRNIGPGDPWSRMRVGITTRLVYVAPRERGLKTRVDDSRRRPNLAPLLLDRALEPALNQNQARVIEILERGFDQLSHTFEG